MKHIRVRELKRQIAELLPLALMGCELRKAEIEARMAEVQQMLDENVGRVAVDAPRQAEAGIKTGRRGRVVTAATRRRMAKAQRARYERQRQAGPAGFAGTRDAKPATKRKISVAGKRAIQEAVKKRWAAFHAAKAAAGAKAKAKAKATPQHSRAAAA